MRVPRSIVAMALALLPSSGAVAQPPGPGEAKATQRPPWVNTWDVAGHAGWVVAGNESAAKDYEVYALGVSAGRWWNEHVKLDLDFSVASAIEDYRFTERDQTFENSSIRSNEMWLGAGLVYQFRSNRTAHPFVGAGVEVRFIRRTEDRWSYPPCSTPSCDIVHYPPEETREVEGGGFGTAGVKFFVSRSAFILVDTRVGFAANGLRVSTRCGFGVDF